jgi:hypothetical protein
MAGRRVWRRRATTGPGFRAAGWLGADAASATAAAWASGIVPRAFALAPALGAAGRGAGPRIA